MLVCHSYVLRLLAALTYYKRTALPQKLQRCSSSSSSCPYTNNRDHVVIIGYNVNRRGQPKPPSIRTCTDARCWVENPHEAKTFYEGDIDTPQIVVQWEANIKGRLAQNLHIHKRFEKKALDHWYEVHDTSRIGSLDPAVPYCTNPDCPATEPHRE